MSSGGGADRRGGARPGAGGVVPDGARLAAPSAPGGDQRRARARGRRASRPEAPAAFDARFSASAREYRYRIDTAGCPIRSRRGSCGTGRGSLDVARMRAAARELLGEHDFTSFCRHPGPGRATVRDLQRLTVARAGDRVELGFRANAFLHQMVRALMGTLVPVGDGKLGPDDVARLLANRDRTGTGNLAPGARAHAGAGRVRAADAPVTALSDDVLRWIERSVGPALAWSRSRSSRPRRPRSTGSSSGARSRPRARAPPVPRRRAPRDRLRVRARARSRGAPDPWRDRRAGACPGRGRPRAQVCDVPRSSSPGSPGVVVRAVRGIDLERFLRRSAEPSSRCTRPVGRVSCRRTGRTPKTASPWSRLVGGPGPGARAPIVAEAPPPGSPASSIATSTGAT